MLLEFETTYTQILALAQPLAQEHGCTIPCKQVVEQDFLFRDIVKSE